LPRVLLVEPGLIWRHVTYLPSRPLSGEVLHAERHRQRRRVDVEARQRPRIARIGQRVADRDLGQAGDRDDVARPASAMSIRRSLRVWSDVTVPLRVTVRPGSTSPAVSSASSRTTRSVAHLDRPVPDRPTAIRRRSRCRQVRDEGAGADGPISYVGGGVTSTSDVEAAAGGPSRLVERAASPSRFAFV
jgi:hypothetical protein